MDAGPQEPQRELMRDGVRARVARLRARPGMSRWPAPVLLGVLCAGAFAPLLTAGAGAAALISVTVGAMTSVGGGVLTEVLLSAAGRLRREDGEPSDEAAETELERRIESVLEAGGESADRLRSDIAQVLREIGAVGAALDGVVQAGDRELQAQLIAGLAEIGAQYGEFRFLMTSMTDELRLIRDGVDEQSGQLQLAVSLQYQQATDIRVLLEQVSALRFPAEPQDAGGGGAGARWAGGSPYRGLTPFAESDAQVFYGREVVTAQLVSTLSGRLAGPGPLIVTGASGAGKSSLLRAGLLPAIGRGELTEPARWWPRRVIGEPSGTPLPVLSRLLATMAGLDAPAVLRSLRDDPRQAHLVAGQAVEADALARGLDAQAAAAGRLVLIVDQFEQIFRAPGQEEEQAAAEAAAFIEALQAIAASPSGPGGAPAGLVVIAVRGDFIDRCASYPDLAAALQRGPFVVGPLTGSELRQTITGPAGTAGLEIEPGLTDTILSDLRSAGGGYGPGVLPLVSQTMATIWDYRDGDRLTSRGYARTGGVTHAVAASADEALDSLPEAAQDVARRVFHQLTAISPAGQLTRRTVPRADLYDGCTQEQRGLVDQVLDTFARKRLLVVDTGTVQIAHDTLLETWPRLAAWLEPDLAGHTLYYRLRDRAAEWARLGHPGAFLYRGEELAAIRQARARWDAEPGRYPPLARTSAAFLLSSDRAETRGVRLRQTVVAALALALGFAVVTAVVAVIAQHHSAYQTNVAISDELAAKSLALSGSDPVVSRLDALDGWAIHQSPQTQYAMRAAAANPQITNLNGDSGDIFSIAFSPDGGTLATSTLDGGIQLWDLATGSLTRIGHDGVWDNFAEINSMAFSPDGKILAVGGDDGSYGRVGLLNVATGRQVGNNITTTADSVSSVAFSPDGKTLAIGTETIEGSPPTSGPNTVQLRNVATGRPVAHALTGSTRASDTYSVAFSPDGKILATGGDHGNTAIAQLWDVATGQQIGTTITTAPFSVESVAFSPDGKTLATNAEGTGQLWNVATHHQIGTSFNGRAGTDQAADFSVAFTPDGKTLLTTDAGMVQLWNAATRKPTGDAYTSTTGTADITSAVFSPDGRTLATANPDGVQLWRTATDEQTSAALATGSNRIVSLSFDRSGDVLATGDSGGTGQLWNLGRGTKIGPSVNSPSEDQNASVAFSPNHREMAAGDATSDASLTSTADNQLISPLFLNTDNDQISAMAFSPDGRTVAVGYDNLVQFFAAATGHETGRTIKLGGNAQVQALAFSPDGKTLVTGDDAGAIRWWNLATAGQAGAAVYDDNPGLIQSLAFNRTGTVLADANNVSTVKLWSVAERRQLGSTIVPDGTVTSVAFSPDGAILATGSDREVQLWDVASDLQVATVGITSGTGAGAQSVAFSPDGATLATGGADGTGRLWNVSFLLNPLRQLCTQAGDSMTRSEWARYVPSGPAYHNACS